jgi:hypothetical protein
MFGKTHLDAVGSAFDARTKRDEDGRPRCRSRPAASRTSLEITVT